MFKYFLKLITDLIKLIDVVINIKLKSEKQNKEIAKMLFDIKELKNSLLQVETKIDLLVEMLIKNNSLK